MNQEFENNTNDEINEANISEETENITEEMEISEISEISENEDNTELFLEDCETPKKKSWKKELWEWIQSLAIAVVAALLIVNFVFSMVSVEGQSMEPTLQSHDFLFVFRLGYTPKNGDVVVFKPVGDPDKYYIKRVIATEGQTVDIVGGDVYVDDELLEEDYIQGITHQTFPNVYPQIVPEDCVFVLGDNREHSRDSRDPIGVGMVEEKSIIGRALFRLFPFSNIGTID